MKPQKHAALIKAWADGAEIQYKDRLFSIWHNFVGGGQPAWLDDIEYRVKPEVIRYRLAIFKGQDGPWINSVDSTVKEAYVEAGDKFIRWHGDWQEVEV